MKAVILSAGYGTRLKPLTDHIPKPLVKVLGISIIEYTLAFMKRNGIKEVYINRHHHPNLFEGISIPQDLNVHFSHEKDILGTLGGLMSFKEHLLDDETLVVNGDIIFNFDLKQLNHFHRSKKNVSTMVLKNKESNNVSSVFVDDFNNVVSIGRSAEGIYSEYMFSGIQIINPEFFEKVKSYNSPGCIVRDFYIPYMNEGGRISGFIADGNFLWKELGDLNGYLNTNLAILDLLSRYKLDHQTESFISDYWFNVRADKIIESVEGIWLGDGYYIDHSATIIPPVLIGSNSKVMANCVIGPMAVIGDNVVVDHDSQIKEAVVLDGAHVQNNNLVEKMVISKDFVFNSIKGTEN